MKSVLETITDGAGYLAKRGVENPRLNMEHLLAHVLKVRRMQLYLWFDRPLAEEELGPLRELTRRRAAREPLQHLLGTVEFLGHTFRCDARALIPRPETEELADFLIRQVKEGRAEEPSSIVDIGTGSGVLGLSLAAAFPQSKVTLVDISPAALALAKENADLLGVTDRCTFELSDLFSALPGQRWAWLVSNPPYIASGEIPELSAEVRHDPHNALDGGPTGIELPMRLVEAAAAHLEPGGRLALETGVDQGPALVVVLLKQGFSHAEATLDLTGRQRFVWATF